MKKSCDYCLTQTENFLTGAKANICYECVEATGLILNKGKTDIPQGQNGEQLVIENKTPQKIINHLNDYIIGQEDAKKTISVSFYNHYKRILLNDNSIKKSDVLITGPSGSGKTIISKTAAELLDIPFYSVDATKFTEAGYVGDDVEDILTGLYVSAGSDITKAQKGIVHIDEIDKIANKNSREKVNSKGVQQALLKMIEGGDFFISPNFKSRDQQGEKIRFNTESILFICSGAFEDIYSVIRKRLKINGNMGFNSKKEEYENEYKLISQVNDQDFIDFGMIKELVGRLPFKTSVKHLTQDDMKKIMIEPKDSIIHGYKKLIAFDGTNINFKEDAIDEIAKLAIAKNIGARGIKSIFDEKLKDIMFESPTHKKGTLFDIDKQYINGEKSIKDIIKFQAKKTKNISKSSNKKAPQKPKAVS